MTPDPVATDQMREKAAGLYTMAVAGVNANRPPVLAATIS